MSETDYAKAVAEFMSTKGVTRCPTVCILPTHASVAEADRAALRDYDAARVYLNVSLALCRAENDEDGIDMQSTVHPLGLSPAVVARDGSSNPEKSGFEGNMLNLMKRGEDGSLLMYRQLAHN